jgi:hypothetical protein
MADFKPMSESYWVEPGFILAGEHPGHWDDNQARRRIAGLLDAGIRVFIDLTDRSDGVTTYRPMLEKICRDRGIHARYLSYPLVSRNVPEHAEDVEAILVEIQAALEARERVYLHCDAGVGRTGMVAGCWLVERGLDPEDALDDLARRFATMNKARVYRITPANFMQAEWVENWQPRLGLRHHCSAVS